MFSKNKGLAKTNSKELLLNKSGVNSGGKGTEREESMAGKERLMAIRQTIQTQKKAGDCPQNGETFRGKDNDDRGF